MALASRLFEDLTDCCGRRESKTGERYKAPDEADGGDSKLPEFLPHSPRKAAMLDRIEVFSARPMEGAHIVGRTQKELELTTLLDAGIDRYRKDDFTGALEKFKRASTEVSRLLRHVQQMNMRPSEQAPMTRVLLSFKGRALACVAQVHFRAAERALVVHGTGALTSRSREEVTDAFRGGMVASREAMRVFLTIGDWEKSEFCVAKMHVHGLRHDVESVIEAYAALVGTLKRKCAKSAEGRIARLERDMKAIRERATKGDMS